MSEEKIVKCPNCGEELSENALLPLAKKEAKEVGFLLLGVVYGAVLGIVGNLWVTFLFELVRSMIPPQLWTLSLLLGLIFTTIVSVYILVRTIKSALRYSRGEVSSDKKKSMKVTSTTDKPQERIKKKK